MGANRPLPIVLNCNWLDELLLRIDRRLGRLIVQIGCREFVRLLSCCRRMIFLRSLSDKVTR